MALAEAIPFASTRYSKNHWFPIADAVIATSPSCPSINTSSVLTMELTIFCITTGSPIAAAHFM